MRILYVAWRPGVGGLQTTLRNRILALKANGIHAEVLFIEQSEGEYIFNNIPFSYVKNIEDFKSKIRSGKYDIISFIFTVEYVRHIPDNFKGKILYEVRGWSPKVAKQVWFISRNKKIHAVICIAKYLVPLVKKNVKWDIPIYVDGNTVNTMFHFISPGLRKNIKYTKTKSRTKVIGFVGRVEESKNWREFIQICEKLSRTEKIEIWIMCNPKTSSDYDDLLKVCSTETLKPMTKIIGLVPNHMMPEAYSAIKSSGGCILSTSRREGLGNSILEPMACGLPVVSSDVPGKNEVITHRVNGMLYKLGDIDSGVDMVKQVLRDKEFRLKIIRNGYKKINKHYRDSVYVERYTKILSQINNKYDQIM
ncbi:MAG: glycosyltransferase family 4 protein [Bacillota bacterium]